MEDTKITENRERNYNINMIPLTAFTKDRPEFLIYLKTSSQYKNKDFRLSLCFILLRTFAEFPNICNFYSFFDRYHVPMAFDRGLLSRTGTRFYSFWTNEAVEKPKHITYN